MAKTTETTTNEMLEWLRQHRAVSLWSVAVDCSGHISMFHINGKAFLVRFYGNDKDVDQGWEVYTNIDPGDNLFAKETLEQLAAYCAT